MNILCRLWVSNAVEKKEFYQNKVEEENLKFC